MDKYLNARGFAEDRGSGNGVAPARGRTRCSTGACRRAGVAATDPTAAVTSDFRAQGLYGCPRGKMAGMLLYPRYNPSLREYLAAISRWPPKK